MVVVAHEWVERAELHPTSAQFFSRVPPEATDVFASERQAKQPERKDRCVSEQILRIYKIR